jgi:transposase
VSLSQCCSCVSCVPGQVAGLLLPHLAGTVAEGAGEHAGRVVLRVRPAGAQAACPGCGTLSGRVHGGYPRRLRDVPAGGRDVVIVLAARRFRCADPGCPKVTFTEQVPGLACRYSRRTPPLAAMLAAVAVELCGRAGARLAAAAGIAAPGRATMTRLVMAAPVPEPGRAPRVLGVDDFALRRGHVYGTVLIDVEAGRAVDLLPDRKAATFRDWLLAHPGAEVICRDRAGAYADGARAGAPGAVQVADRWHLWSNLGEKALEAAAAHTRACLAPARPPGPGPRDPGPQDPGPRDPGPRDPGPAPAGPGGGREAKARRRHAEIRALLDAGHTPSAAARILGLSRTTVRKYAAAPAPAGPPPDHGRLAIPAPAPPPPRPRAIARLLMTRPANLAAAETAALAAVTAACPHLARLRDHIAAFADIMTSRDGTARLDAWLAAADASGLPQLQSFAAGIRRDHAAVLAGLTLPYSSGKVEGTVNKIKMLKRQTYGRAGFPLLRQRVLLATKP